MKTERKKIIFRSLENLHIETKPMRQEKTIRTFDLAHSINVAYQYLYLTTQKPPENSLVCGSMHCEQMANMFFVGFPYEHILYACSLRSLRLEIPFDRLCVFIQLMKNNVKEKKNTIYTTIEN